MFTVSRVITQLPYLHLVINPMYFSVSGKILKKTSETSVDRHHQIFETSNFLETLVIQVTQLNICQMFLMNKCITERNCLHFIRFILRNVKIGVRE